MQKLFANRTVIISGGLGDIGRAVAIEFAGHGANVALGDVRPATDAAALLASLEIPGVNCLYHQVDVTRAEAVRDWVAKVEATFGTPDLIIANAARVTVANVLQVSDDEWSADLRVNLDGAFHLAQTTTTRLVERGMPGRVVFMGSWAAYTPHTHIPAYCVSKAGLRMLCKCMALELAPYQILVNELAPGYVEAGLSNSIWEENPGAKESALLKVPIKKLITAKQVAEQVVQLCHPENIHMTGTSVLMDGGLSLLS